VAGDRDTLTNPVTGEQIRFVGDSTDRLEMDFTLRPGGFVPVVHVHPNQEERFDVLAGRPQFRVGRNKRVAQAGESVTVPPRVPHVLANPGADEVRVRITFTPALRTREMFEVITALANTGKMSRRGIPRNPFLGALLAREFRNEAVPGGIWRIPNAFASVGAAIARAFGLRLPSP
jgi:mannose-6-phosphate isomerase-like protein (cupin superfamily)